MGDLGMHALHLPLRSGLGAEQRPRLLSDIVRSARRRGGRRRLRTWDNATLLCEVEDEGTSSR